MTTIHKTKKTANSEGKIEQSLRSKVRDLSLLTSELNRLFLAAIKMAGSGIAPRIAFIENIKKIALELPADLYAQPVITDSPLLGVCFYYSKPNEKTRYTITILKKKFRKDEITPEGYNAVVGMYHQLHSEQRLITVNIGLKESEKYWKQAKSNTSQTVTAAINRKIKQSFKNYPEAQLISTSLEVGTSRYWDDIENRLHLHIVATCDGETGDAIKKDLQKAFDTDNTLLNTESKPCHFTAGAIDYIDARPPELSRHQKESVKAASNQKFYELPNSGGKQLSFDNKAIKQAKKFHENLNKFQKELELLYQDLKAYLGIEEEREELPVRKPLDPDSHWYKRIQEMRQHHEEWEATRIATLKAFRAKLRLSLAREEKNPTTALRFSHSLK